MRTSEIEILIVPGWGNSGPDHWQSRWERHFKSARRIGPAGFDTPRLEDWVDCLVAEAARVVRPAVLVAHGCGVPAVVAAAPRLASTRVVGAFLVAPTDLDENKVLFVPTAEFAAMPKDRLPFPAKLIVGSNDPLCSIERAQAFGAQWGADTSIIAGAGHFDAESGQGPWPEGLLTFGVFLRSLGEVPGRA